MGEFRKAWQQRCNVNEPNYNEEKKRLPHGISFTMKTDCSNKNMKSFKADSVA
jgi:hypothetical protein